MTYPAGGSAGVATFRPVADVPEVAGRATSIRLVAPGAVTEGEFGLFRFEMTAHFAGPRPHFHKTFTESFYVLAGTVRLYDGKGWAEAAAGDFLFVPRGGIHAFSNDADEAASVLILFAPGTPRERFFEEMAEIEASGRQLSPEERTELYARHDQYMV